MSQHSGTSLAYAILTFVFVVEKGVGHGARSGWIKSVRQSIYHTRFAREKQANDAYNNNCSNQTVSVIDESLVSATSIKCVN